MLELWINQKWHDRPTLLHDSVGWPSVALYPTGDEEDEEDEEDKRN